MRGFAKVVVLGNVGRDPEVRYTQGGLPVTSFSVAATEQWKDKSGAKQERTEWVRVVCFGKLAEIARDYVKKGSPIYLEGKQKTDEWLDKDGNKRNKTECVVDGFDGKLVLLPDGKKAEDRKERVEAATERYLEGQVPDKEPFQATDDDVPF